MHLWKSVPVRSWQSKIKGKILNKNFKYPISKGLKKKFKSGLKQLSFLF